MRGAVRVIARGMLLQSLRRKDLYVVLMLSGLIMCSAALVRFWGVSGAEKFVLDISLTVIGILMPILAVVLGSEPIPAEQENRTIYPLLAKPISRWEFLLGKFLGGWSAAALGLLLMHAILLLTILALGSRVGLIYGQGVLLRLFDLGLLVALSLCLSLWLTRAANIVVCLLARFGMGLLQSLVLLTVGSGNGALRGVGVGLYWLLPHFELFDLDKKVVHSWPAVPWLVVLGVGGYTLLAIGLLLGLAHFRFRRRVL